MNLNYLRTWTEQLPTGDRLYSLLAIGLIAAAVLGGCLFISLAIVPQWRARGQLASKLAEVQQQLVEAERKGEKNPEQLKEKLATTQAKLNEAASVFFSESEAAEVLNNLYQYASESGVEIINLQTQPSSGEKKGAYDIRAFQLQVEGAFPKLMDFVSRIEEAALESFIIANVNIIEGEMLPTLTMDITLYTSPHSSGAAVPATSGATRPATPADLAQVNEALAFAWASGEWKQAIDLINQILTIEPHYDDMVEKLYAAYVNYGYQLWEEGDTGGATTQFNLALEIKPEGEEALAGLQQAAATPSPTLTVEEQLAQRLHEPWAAEDWEEVIKFDRADTGDQPRLRRFDREALRSSC